MPTDEEIRDEERLRKEREALRKQVREVEKEARKPRSLGQRIEDDALREKMKEEIEKEAHETGKER